MLKENGMIMMSEVELEEMINKANNEKINELETRNKMLRNDDADYYWAYSYDKENWTIVFKGKVIQRLNGTFEEVVDLIENQNKDIKPCIIHW